MLLTKILSNLIKRINRYSIFKKNFELFQKKIEPFQKNFVPFQKNFELIKKNYEQIINTFFSFKIRCKYKLSEIKTKIKIV